MQNTESLLFGRREIGRLEILLHRVCNLRCDYCYVHKTANFEFDETVVMETVRMFFDALGVQKSLVIYGGEPFLLPRKSFIGLLRNIERLKKDYAHKSVDITICTNLSVEDIEYYQAVLPYIDRLSISCDGPLGTHEKNRGAGSFVVFEKNLNMLVGLGSEVVKKLNINKVVWNNTTQSMFSDIVYILNKFSAVHDISVDVVPALGVSGWNRDDAALFQIAYYKLFLYFKNRPELLRLADSLLQIPLRTCIYSSISLGVDGLIHNCGFISNKMDNLDQYIADITTHTLNPRISVRECIFDLTNDNCANETCSICCSVCTDFCIPSNTKDAVTTFSAKRQVKLSNNFRTIYLKHYPIHIISIQFAIFSEEQIYAAVNCIISLGLMTHCKVFKISTSPGSIYDTTLFVSEVAQRCVGIEGRVLADEYSAPRIYVDLQSQNILSSTQKKIGTLYAGFSLRHVYGAE